MRSCEILRLSLLASGAVLWSFHAKAQSHPTGGVFEPPSPPVTNPFIEELGRMPIKTALPGGVSDLVCRRTAVSHRMAQSTRKSPGRTYSQPT